MAIFGPDGWVLAAVRTRISQEESLIPKATVEFATRRWPNFRLPPNACDAHCHVIGPGNLFP
jgi:hypothetical protein